MKFPFQRYIVCLGKIYGSKIIGGERLRLLFCKIVYTENWLMTSYFPYSDDFSKIFVRDFVAEYDHDNFGGIWTTKRERSRGGAAYILPKYPSRIMLTLSYPGGRIRPPSCFSSTILKQLKASS